MQVRHRAQPTGLAVAFTGVLGNVGAQNLDKEHVAETRRHDLRAGIFGVRLRRHPLQRCLQPRHHLALLAVYVNKRRQRREKRLRDFIFKDKMARNHRRQ
ncbi:MAG: hypothetical protein ALAOOOJD_03914 [bacterium]|nr:hypothetical protein [bacterium]